MRYLGGGGGGITVQRYFAFESTVGLWTLYIQELRYTNTFCECILKKIGPTHAHFQYNARKQEPINVVKVRFSMRYFSRKLSHEKVRYNHSLQLLKANNLFFPG